MKFLRKVGDAFEDAGEGIADVSKTTYKGVKKGVQAVGKGISTVMDPIQKMADNPVFRAIDKMYKKAIPEPYGSYMKMMTSSSALVGAALDGAGLLPGNGILLSGGQSVLPGHPTYGEITKKGKAAQIKAMGDLVSAAANTPEARKALEALKAADPKLYDRLLKETQRFKDLKATANSIQRQIETVIGPQSSNVVRAALRNDPVAVRKASTGAMAIVVDSLRQAHAGQPQLAIKLLQQNQMRASQARGMAPGSARAPATFYRVTTPSGRVIDVPRERVER